MKNKGMPRRFGFNIKAVHVIYILLFATLVITSFLVYDIIVPNRVSLKRAYHYHMTAISRNPISVESGKVVVTAISRGEFELLDTYSRNSDRAVQSTDEGKYIAGVTIESPGSIAVYTQGWDVSLALHPAEGQTEPPVIVVDHEMPTKLVLLGIDVAVGAFIALTFMTVLASEE